MSELRFVGATPVWWRSRCEVSICIDLGAQAAPALVTLRSVAELEGPLPEVLMLVPAAASPSAEAALEWLLHHMWLPALVLEGDGPLHARARAPRVLSLTGGDVLDHGHLLSAEPSSGP